MNLYWVCEKQEDWGMYIFSEDRGRSKSLYIKDYPSLSDPDFTDIRVYLIKKDVGGVEEVCYEDCDRLKNLSCFFQEPEDI